MKHLALAALAATTLCACATADKAAVQTTRTYDVTPEAVMAKLRSWAAASSLTDVSEDPASGVFLVRHSAPSTGIMRVSMGGWTICPLHYGVPIQQDMQLRVAVQAAGASRATVRVDARFSEMQRAADHSYKTAPCDSTGRLEHELFAWLDEFHAAPAKVIAPPKKGAKS